MYDIFRNIQKSISLQPFQSYFGNYLSSTREAKGGGASYDYLRQIFIEFARESFRADPTDVELEKGIKGSKLRGAAMLYTGLDYHRSFSYITTVNNKSKIISQKKLPSNGERIEVAIEARENQNLKGLDKVNF